MLENVPLTPQSATISAGSGVVAGYASGRVVKLAVDIVKSVVGIFVGIEVAMHEAGLITIHFDKVQEFLTRTVGSSDLSGVLSEVTEIIFSYVPMAGGFGAGFYAGYKKVLI